MQKNFFIALFIVVHISFFFLQIHKQMEHTKESFRVQKNERELAKLDQNKLKLTNELQLIQNKQNIKKFAQNKLGLKPIHLTQIHTLSSHE